MAADSGNFPAFDSSDLSSRLAFQNRLPFGAPQPSPFVAHFYPMVNSAGAAPLFIPPEPSQSASNPGSILASVAAGRPDLVYTELYKNLFKTVGKLPIEGTNDYRDTEKDIKSNKFNFFDPQKSPNTSNEILGKRKFPKYDFIPNSLASPSPLRSFYEGIYNRLTPNDYLLRLRAEQQFASKNSNLRRKPTLPHTQPRPLFRNPQFIDADERGSAFSRTGTNQWTSQYLTPTFHTQSSPTDQSEKNPESDTSVSSPAPTTPPRPSKTSSNSPLDFRLPKLQSSPPIHAGYQQAEYSKSIHLPGTTLSFQEQVKLGQLRVNSAAKRPDYLFNFNSKHSTSFDNQDFGMKPLSTTVGPSPIADSDLQQAKFKHDISTTVGNTEPTDKQADSKICPISLTTSDLQSRISPIYSEPRLKRKRRLTSAAETCPVCGITVRSSELKQHFLQEVARLEKIAHDVHRNSRKVHHDRRSSTLSSGSNSNHASTSVTPTTSKKQTEGDGQQAQHKENRFKTFQKVCANRIDRFNSRVGQCQSSMWRNGSTAGLEIYPTKVNGATWLDYNRNVIAHNKSHPFGGRFEGVRCPVCDVSLSHLGNHDQISDHVIECAGARNGDIQDDVDVENDDGTTFGAEYEWCGETRVRATAVVHRATLESSPGFQMIRNANNDDSDQDLNVETDETCEFGVAQFEESDLLPPCPSDEEGTSTKNTIHIADELDHAKPKTDSTPHSMLMQSSSSNYSGCQSPSVVVQALRLKIQELENWKQGDHCLICMESYKKPLVSIQCWHVHCEECWMKALGVKKLCPQCNMITPTSQLRRIFL